MSEVKTGGQRHNQGKPRISLVPSEGIKAAARAFTRSYESGKYPRHDYYKGFSWSELIDSLERHILAFKEGEDIDEDSAGCHIDNMCANAMLLADGFVHHKEFDDRYKRPKKAEE